MKHESNRFVTWKTYLCPKEHTNGQIGITLRTNEETARSRCTDEGHLRRDGHSIQRTLLALFFRAPHLHQPALRRMRYGKCVRPRAATSQQRVETQTARLPRRIVRQSEPHRTTFRFQQKRRTTFFGRHRERSHQIPAQCRHLYRTLPVLQFFVLLRRAESGALYDILYRRRRHHAQSLLPEPVGRLLYRRGAVLAVSNRLSDVQRTKTPATCPEGGLPATAHHRVSPNHERNLSDTRL